MGQSNALEQGKPEGGDPQGMRRLPHQGGIERSVPELILPLGDICSVRQRIFDVTPIDVALA